MKEIFAEYISETRMSEYQPVQVYCGLIAKEQALQDIEQLIYIIDNRYCGKEYWERKGIKFLDCYQEIRDFVLRGEEIYISDYCRDYFLLHKIYFASVQPTDLQNMQHTVFDTPNGRSMVMQTKNDYQQFPGQKPYVVLILQSGMKYRRNMFSFQRWRQRGKEDILWGKEVIKIWIQCQFW